MSIQEPQKPSAVQWPEGEPQKLRQKLLDWHKVHGRHHLPWISAPNAQGDINDYHVAVSEIMMQQTTVSVGMKRFPQWIAQFPNWNALAKASEEEVMKAWEGLGYYARARSLHKMAHAVVLQHKGVIPKERSLRLKLAGVGQTTASALGAFIYGYREPIWDANVNRVWRRWWANRHPENLSISEQTAWNWSMAQSAMPTAPARVRAWTQALMDLGAMVCTPKNPKCGQCPLRTSCQAFALNETDKWGVSVSRPVVQPMWKHWAWLVQDSKVAVVAPSDKGLWPGLWRLPEFQIQSPWYEHAHALGNDAQGSHKLTHRHISWSINRAPYDINLLQAWADNVLDPLPEIQWVGIDRFNELALPKPLRSWWDSLPPSDRLQWMNLSQ